MSTNALKLKPGQSPNDLWRETLGGRKGRSARPLPAPLLAPKCMPAPVVRAGEPLVITVPMQTYNLNNSRIHWRVRSERVREQREAVTYALLGVRWNFKILPKPMAETPWDVLLVRLSPRTLDRDGVVSALKGARDAVAAFVNVDDRYEEIVEYRYHQRKQRGQAVEITITARKAG